MGRELTREERIRMKKRARRKAMARRKRRFYALLFVLFAVLIVFLVIRFKKGKPEAESTAAPDGMPTAGAAMGESRAVYGNGDMSETGSQEKDNAPVTGAGAGAFAGATDVMSAIDASKPLDVTSGKAAVDLTQAGNSMGQIQAAKSAMESCSYFTGTNQPVNSFFQAYGPGTWHGIKDVADNICVFYEGIHVESETYLDDDGNQQIENRDVPFKVVFVVYEDGSFSVTDAVENGRNIDDIEQYLKKIVGGV